MFHGDRVDVVSFELVKRIPSGRLRLVADVNGSRCFVKQFGDLVLQVAIDELKSVVGLNALGLSLATVPPYGEVLLAPWLGDRGVGHDRFNTLTPTQELAQQVLPVLWFDTWIHNNDRTSQNLLRTKSGRVIPIDESAAFKKPSTLRLTPQREWYDVLRLRAVGYESECWPPDNGRVREVMKRFFPSVWASKVWFLEMARQNIKRDWERFWDEADHRVLRRCRVSCEINLGL